MTAEKGNKVYTIDDKEKQSYQTQGFDIKDEDGEIIAYGNGKTVPYEQYAQLEKAHMELMAAYEGLVASHDEQGKQEKKPPVKKEETGKKEGE